MDKNFNISFGVDTVNTAIEKKTEDGKVVTRWERSYMDKDGKVKTLEVSNPKIIKALVTIDNLAMLNEFSSMGMCFELASISADIDCLNGFKSIADVGSKLFGLKASTSTQYARVGKYFVSRTDKDGKTAYKLLDWLPAGTTITNIVQCLSLINEDEDEPCAKLREYIENGDININGTLARVKADLKKIKEGTTEDDNVVNADKVTEIVSKPDNQESTNRLEDIIADLLAISHIDEYSAYADIIAEFIEKIQNI